MSQVEQVGQTEMESVLVCNCGSSSIKFAMVQPANGKELISGIAERLGSPEAQLVWKVSGEKQQQSLPGADHQAALNAVLDILSADPQLKPSAVGHRIVHGGEHFSASALIDDEMLAQVQAISHLAPLHNPANLLGIKAAQAAFPSIPQVAVFDTAFHMSMPDSAYRYAVPEAWYQEHGVRRYGFHGTSHRYVAQQATELLGKSEENTKVITAHLGNGCSAAAVDGGRSLDTTMGLTPLEGLVMGTRSGDVDPSVLAFMAQRLDCDVHQVTNMLNKQSGLLGLSGGLASDMRQLVAASEEGHSGASLAIEVFCFRLAKAIAGLMVSLGNCDALVFTGGIGEHAANIRAKVLSHLGFLGFALDELANENHGKTSEQRITSDGSATALVIPTNEELQIARETQAVISDQAALAQ